MSAPTNGLATLHCIDDFELCNAWNYCNKAVYTANKWSLAGGQGAVGLVARSSLGQDGGYDVAWPLGRSSSARKSVDFASSQISLNGPIFHPKYTSFYRVA